MLRKAGVPIEENKEVLPEFFVYRFVMPPDTLYRNIRQVSSGDRLHIKMSNEKCTIQLVNQYNLSNQDKNINSIKSSSKQIIDFLSKSIERLTTHKKNIAAILSGGIDSSILCKIYQDLFGLDQSYSTGYPFEDPESNTEKEYALSAGNALGMEHHYHESTNQEYLRGFLEAVSSAECPLHHLQSVCLHLLFKNGIPKNKNIIMQGQGGAGYFGNFRNYLYFKDKMPYKMLAKEPFHKISGKLSRISGIGEKTVDLLYKSAQKYPLSKPNNLIWYWHDYGSKEWVCNYLNVKEEDIIKGQYNLLKRFEGDSIYDIASMYSLLGDEDITLSIWTKIAEGNEKILYSPFYDLDVLDYVFSMPWKLKLKRPENILRKTIARQCGVPKFIITRRKSGFGVQPKLWSKPGSAFEPLVPLASKVFDIHQIRKMQSTDPKKAMIFWNILNYSIWKRLCIYNEPLEVLMEELNETI